MNVTVLGSGSGGNAILVESDGRRILVDAGFSGRELARRLACSAVDPESIDAIVVTHDHHDHTRGAGIAARRWGIPVYLSADTFTACARLFNGEERLECYEARLPFRIGDLEVSPFTTVHDAADPIAVTVEQVDSGKKLGIATDLGRPTAGVRHALRGCHLLILEANHDPVMLRGSPYPWSVQQRIAGSHGHLSNTAAAELGASLAHDDLECVVLAHLSQRANDPGLAAEVIGPALERVGFAGSLTVARQDEPLDPIAIRGGVRESQLHLTLGA